MNSFLATRPFSVGVAVSEVANKQSSEKGSKEQALVEEKAFDDITDQIPHIVRPMGVVEGTSYGVLILAGLAFAGKDCCLPNLRSLRSCDTITQ